ncbi:MAG: D-inositol-3-phosphate glycosyltransferase [Nocardioidaceae bacterium]
MSPGQLRATARLTAAAVPRRVAMLSMHTSPLDQPGTGDAGGMNVYVLELSKRLAARGVEVEVFTRATSSDLPPVIECGPGVTVRHIVSGPFEGLSKADLPGQMCTFSRDVLRVEALHEPGRYDLIHSHYWLSGQVGALCRDRWAVPLVHSMHTMGKVKNAALARGDVAEPMVRIVGEEQVVDAADRLIANTAAEADELVRLYAADPARVDVVHPGVDLDRFRPGRELEARARLGLAADATVLLFAGRLQPLKAPDVFLEAAAALVAQDPAMRDGLVVAVVGGPSGSGLQRPDALAELTTSLGLGGVATFVPPVDHPTLADWYAAATLVCVPSYNESFGLVALEAEACGTPVVAAAVGGLTTAVSDGRTGLLVAGHDPRDYAAAIRDLLTHPERLALMGDGAARHAAAFSWDHTTDATLDVYAAARKALSGEWMAVS